MFTLFSTKPSLETKRFSFNTSLISTGFSKTESGLRCSSPLRWEQALLYLLAPSDLSLRWETYAASIHTKPQLNENRSKNTGWPLSRRRYEQPYVTAIRMNGVCSSHPASVWILHQRRQIFLSWLTRLTCLHLLRNTELNERTHKAILWFRDGGPSPAESFLRCGVLMFHQSELADVLG